MFQRLRKFARRETGTATLEFCIVFPIIMILFIAVFETAMILIRQVMLERALDNTVRLLRLSRQSGGDRRSIRSGPIVCFRHMSF